MRQNLSEDATEFLPNNKEFTQSMNALQLTLIHSSLFHTIKLILRPFLQNYDMDGLNSIGSLSLP
jgi:hypothetical protein